MQCSLRSRRWLWEYIDALPQWQQAIQETIKRKVQSHFVL